MEYPKKSSGYYISKISKLESGQILSSCNLYLCRVTNLKFHVKVWPLADAGAQHYLVTATTLIHRTFTTYEEGHGVSYAITFKGAATICHFIPLAAGPSWYCLTVNITTASSLRIGVPR